MAEDYKDKGLAKLREALEISEKCDPTDCDCETCPIGKDMELVAHDSGVKIVATVCSMIQALEDVCLEPKEFKYKPF